MVKSRADISWDRSLPHSIETERSILGVVLLDNRTIHQVLETLTRDDFYLDAHRRIFDKMVYLYEKGRPIDPVTLREELARSGELEQVGGTGFIASLMDGVPQLQNIDHYAKIVRDKSMLRRLILASSQTIAACFDQQEEPQVILDRAERSIFEIAEERLTPGFVTVAEVARRQLELVEQMAGRPQMITGLPTGFSELDQLTSGLQPGDLVIVAGRPSSGKTSLALSIAQNAARRGYIAGFMSLEMSKEQLVARMLCSEARINLHRFRGGFLSRDEWGRLAEALGHLAESKIFIDDSPGLSALEVRAKARRLRHERGLDLLIVDYLQLMAARGRAENRQQEVSQISRDLKSIAKDLNIPLVAVSQLSRAPEARTDHRPQLSDLRESGCLAGDTLVTVADSGRRVPIVSLVGRSGFHVWALNEQTWRLEPALVSRAFSTGRKPLYRIKTHLGRVVCATGNHRFRTFRRWERLDELQVGDRIALPRIMPDAARGSISPAEVGLLGHLIGQGCTLPRHAVQYITHAHSDVYWDEIVAIEPHGEAEVYDLTVERLHNFVANDVIVHNSLEQDADVVIFVYREEMYNPTDENAGIAEIIVGKQRNGPVGTVRLAFLKEFTRFENLWEE